MTTENSRADAQFLSATDAEYVRRFRQRDYACVIEWQELSAVVRYICSLETRSHVEQPAAAPSGYCERAGGCVCGGDLPRVREGCSEWVKSKPAPSPADERAVHALDCQYILDDNPWAICTCGKGSPNNPRAASANETVAEPTACKGKNCGSLDPRFHSEECFEEYEKTVGLKPAQADARVGMTETFENWWKSLEGTYHRHDEFYIGVDGDWIHKNDVEDIYKTLRAGKTS